MADGVIEVRGLLEGHRAAAEGLAEAEARCMAEADAATEAVRAREARGGPGWNQEDARAQEDRRSEFVARWRDPADAALARLRAACCILLDLSPAERSDRARAVAVDGTLCVFLDATDEDPGLPDFFVVRPEDVLTLGPAARPAEDPEEPGRGRRAGGRPKGGASKARA